MKELSSFAKGPIRPPKGTRHAVLVRDRKTGQAVTIASEEPLVAFELDDERRAWWKAGEPHTDAVVIAKWNGEPVIVFVELTVSVQLKVKKATGSGAAPVEDPIDRKQRQIDGIIGHFHPAGRTGGTRTHGDGHHDAWRDGRDLPTILPSADHRVGAIVLGFHQQARDPLGPIRVGGRAVPRAVWSPVPNDRNRASVAFRRIAAQLGW
jgi:hypothetical protein